MNERVNILTLKRLGIDTQREFIIFMHKDCEVCISEGFQALTRIEVHYKESVIIATLNIINSGLLNHHQASLSESAWNALNAEEGTEVVLRHLAPIESYNFVKQKILGKKLTPTKYYHIIEDIVKRKYSSTQMAAFITASSGESMTTEEIVGLTEAMINTGEKLSWTKEIIADKHCIGGLPGNRTTPIVVAICAAAGLHIPKTSSRAITSPAGTADTMAVFTNVNLSIENLKNVLEKENACYAWGGAINLSPADDIMIRVERSIDMDSEGQMIASILSKKAAAGSTHILIDIPVGLDQKVTSYDDAEILKGRFELVGMALGLKLQVIITNGEQPIGFGIGPMLEAIDVIKVFKNDPEAPEDLKEKSITLAFELLQLVDEKYCVNNCGEQIARKILESGLAYEKFKSICQAQGYYNEPKIPGKFQKTIYSDKSGTINYLHSMRLAKIAKLAGAPLDAEAGVLIHKKLNDEIKKGEPLFTVYANSKGELEYALDFISVQSEIYHIQ